MQTTQALTQLGLDDGATQAEVEQAYQQRSARISGLLDKAPSDTLKHKYQTKLTQLAAAKALLLEPEIMNETTDNTANAAPRSPLSETKLADLPGAVTSMVGAPDADELHAGQLLANRYQIKGQIGAGGMGAVYHAFDQSKQEDVAVKVLLPALVKDDRARSRFMDEARISAKLSHPGIVNVFDVQQDGDYLFLTMELLEGQDLRSLMETRKLSRQPFDEGEAKQLISALCTALSYAHKYTVHRDLKPENIWVTEEGEYKIMDFGIARVMSNSQRTQTGMAMGTAYYMAPEQLKGTAKVDGRADIYALGVLLYELLTGEVPAGRIKPLRELRKDLSKGFAAAIDKTLEPNPDERFIDTEAFAKAANNTGNISLSLPWKPIGIAAGVLVALLGVGGLVSSGGLNIASLKDLLPMSQQDIAQNKAAAARIQGEIQVLKRRLSSVDRELQRKISEARREKNYTEEARLNEWQTLVQAHTIDGFRYGEYEGLEAQSKVYLEEKEFVSALKVIAGAREGYAGLNSDFTAAESLSADLPRILRQLDDWRQHRFTETWALSKVIEASHNKAGDLLADGFVGLASKAYKTAYQQLQPLLAQVTELYRMKQSIASRTIDFETLGARLSLGEVADVVAQQSLLVKAEADVKLATDQQMLSGVLQVHKVADATLATVVAEVKETDDKLVSARQKRKAYLAYTNNHAIDPKGRWHGHTAAEKLLASTAESLAKGNAVKASQSATAAASAFGKNRDRAIAMVSNKALTATGEEACLSLAKTTNTKLCDDVIRLRKKADMQLTSGDIDAAEAQFAILFKRYTSTMHKGIKQYAIKATDAFEFYLPLKNSTKMEMVFIPGGELQLGFSSGIGKPYYETPVKAFSFKPFVMAKYLLGCKELKAYFPTKAAQMAEGCKPDKLPFKDDQSPYLKYPVTESTFIGAMNESLGLFMRRPTNAELEYVLAGKDAQVFRYMDSKWDDDFESICYGELADDLPRIWDANNYAKRGDHYSVKRLINKNGYLCSLGGGAEVNDLVQVQHSSSAYDKQIARVLVYVKWYLSVADDTYNPDKTTWGVYSAFYKTRTQDCYQKGNPYSSDPHTPVGGGNACKKTLRRNYYYGQEKEGNYDYFYHVSTGYSEERSDDNSAAIRLVLPL